jgi:hypothetical protein
LNICDIIGDLLPMEHNGYGGLLIMQAMVSGTKSTETMFDLKKQKIEQVKAEIAKVVIDYFILHR